MDMRQRIIEGKLFLDCCQGLEEERLKAKEMMLKFNQSDPRDKTKRQQLQNEIFDRETRAHIEQPFYFTYGKNIMLGDGCYVNYNCNFIDDGEIEVGANTMFGANVTIATVGHPVHPDYRQFMYAEKVTIGRNCWIGAGTVINPGISIGENTVIGSGSIVIKDVPKNSVAVGNPCKVLREISEEDLRNYRKGIAIDFLELEELKRVNQTT